MVRIRFSLDINRYRPQAHYRLNSHPLFFYTTEITQKTREMKNVEYFLRYMSRRYHITYAQSVQDDQNYRTGGERGRIRTFDPLIKSQML